MSIHDNLLNPRRRSPLLLPIVVIALLGLVGGAFALGRFSARDPSQEETATAPQPTEATEEGAVDEPATPPAPTEVAMGEILPGTDGLRRVRVEIQGSLSASINRAIGSEVGDPLALVSSRVLIWWLDPSRDLRPGDTLEVLYSLPSGEEPLVHGLHFHSSKLGKAMRAYRWHAPGAPFARIYDVEGNEIEQRLKDSPIDTYEQITSLLKDGRRHKGVDFKAPVGTPVTMPWAGVVKRKNWNMRVNGGSLEVEDAKGRKIVFLHLDSVEKSLVAGSRVRKGQLVAHSGNTGRSTAPHLHYQVTAANGRVLDPFDLHDTWRLALPASDVVEFRGRVAEIDRLLDEGATVAAAAE